MTDIGWLEPAQREIVPQLRPFLAERWPIARIREVVDAGTGFDHDQLAAAAQSDWHVPMASSWTLPQALVIAQEWGRVLAPSWLVDLNVVADTLRHQGSAQQRLQTLRLLRTGAQVVAWCAQALPAPNRWQRNGSAVRVTAQPQGFRLTGSVEVVTGAGMADLLLVAAADGDAVTQFLVPTVSPGVSLRPLQGLDPTRALFEVGLDGVLVGADAVVGQRRAGAVLAERQSQVAVALAVAMTTGTMAALFETALEYAKVRTAFGRAIGSFQAVKHQLVDASLVLEMSRSVSEEAGAAVARGSADAAEIASMAKSYVGRAGVELAHLTWQTLGGIAYMWDNDFHLFLRRITADASFYGDPDWHEERLCRIHSLGALA